MPFAPPVDLGPDPTAPVAPVAPVVPAPVAAPPAPAPDAATGAYWNQFRQAYKDLPLAQAQTAINAAMKYQGIRGYQRDLAAGKPAAEALARWGPLMLSSDRGAGGLAGAAAMTRAATPPTHFGTRGEVLRVMPDGTVKELRPPTVSQEPKVHFGVHGEVLQVSPQGEVKILNPGTPPPRKLEGEVAIRDEALKGQISELAKAWIKETDPERKGELRLQHDRLVDERAALLRKPIAPPAPVPASPAAKYASPESVRAAVRSKKITRDEAKKILQTQFGYE